MAISQILLKNLKFSFHPFFLFVICLSFQSCAPQVGARVTGGNDAFKRKYGRQIEKISKDRDDSKDPNLDFGGLRAPEGQGQLSLIENTENNFRYQGIVKFGEAAKQQKFFPDSETYERAVQTGATNKLPPDIFEISYNTRLNPAFKRIGQEFDRIEIPNSDIYGISSSNRQKPYLLASRDSIQKAITTIKLQRAKELQNNDSIFNPTYAYQQNNELEISDLIDNQNSTAKSSLKKIAKEADLSKLKKKSKKHLKKGFKKTAGTIKEKTAEQKPLCKPRPKKSS